MLHPSKRCNVQNDTRRLNPMSMHVDKRICAIFVSAFGWQLVAQGGVRGALRLFPNKVDDYLIRRERDQQTAPRAENQERKLPRSGTSRKAAISSARRCGRPANPRELLRADRPAISAPARRSALRRNNWS